MKQQKKWMLILLASSMICSSSWAKTANKNQTALRNGQSISEKNKPSKKNNKHLGLKSSAENSSQGFSAAKNFLNSGQVDQQTGALSVSFPVAVIHDGIQGGAFTLTVGYSYGASNDRFDLGDSWGFNLGYQSYTGSAAWPEDRIQSLITDTGQTYPFQVALKNQMRLHKLQDAKKVDNSDGSVILFLKNGDSETFSKLENTSGNASISGVLTKKCFSGGQCLNFNYTHDMGTASSHRQLASITDNKTGKVLVSLKWSSVPDQVTVKSMDNQGSLNRAFTLNLDQDYGVTSISAPTQNTTNFIYCGTAKGGPDACSGPEPIDVNLDRLYQVNYPTGLTSEYKYGALPVFNPSGGGSYSTVISQVLEYPRGTDNAVNFPPNMTSYSFFSEQNSHTYQGLGATQMGSEPGVDPFYGVDTGYTYTTSKDNGLATDKYTYNRFHLLVRQVTYEDTNNGSGPLLTYTNKCYPGGSKGDLGLCLASDTDTTTPVDTGVSYDDLPADYSFAKATFTHLVPLSGRNADAKDRATVSMTTYDSAGNQVASVDPMGVKKNTVFCETGKSVQKGCPVNAQFVKYPLTETETGSQGKLSQLQQFVYTTVKGESDPRMSEQKFGYLQSGSPVFWKKSNYSYCNTDDKACSSADLAGLLSGESTSTLGSAAKSMALNTMYTKGSDNVTYTRNISLADGTQSNKEQSSLYTGQMLSIQVGDNDKIKTNYFPDGQIKDKQQCSSDGSNCQTLMSYQYIEAINSPDSLNHIITTYPGGWQTNESYDGLNHLASDAERNSSSDDWMVHATDTYDQYGRATQMDTFNDVGDAPADTPQYFYFDASGRNHEKLWPANKAGDQIASTSLVDVAYNRTITFYHLINATSGDESLQAIGAVDSDSNSRIMGKYRISVEPDDYTGALKTELTALVSSFQSLDDSLMNHEDIIGKVEGFVNAVIKAKEYYQFHTYQYDGLERLIGEHINGHEVEQYVYSPEGLLESSISTYPQDGEASSKQTNYGYDCLNGQVDRLTVVSTIDNTQQALCAVSSLAN